MMMEIWAIKIKEFNFGVGKNSYNLLKGHLWCYYTQIYCNEEIEEIPEIRVYVISENLNY